MMIDNIAGSLDVKVTIIDNLADPNLVRIGTEMKNSGTDYILPSTWCIYFNYIRLLNPNTYPYPEGELMGNTGLRLFHVTGSLYRWCPDTNIFKPVKPGGALKFEFYAKYWQTTRTDFMPRYYVTSDGLEPKTIVSTDGETLNYVTDITQPMQYKRYAHDQYRPLLARERYAINSDIIDDVITDEEIEQSVVPTPLLIERPAGAHTHVHVTTQWKIIENNDFINEINLLSGKCISAFVEYKCSMYRYM